MCVCCLQCGCNLCNTFWCNWASEASPTLGCSIDISRDIYMCMSVGLSKGNPYKKLVCQNAWAELRGPNTRMLKVSFGRLNCDIRVIHFYYMLEQL